MANEIKNRDFAVGTFVPAPVAPFTSNVLNSVGVDAFVRNSAGNYTVQLTDAIGFAGAHAVAGLPPNFLGIIGAQLAPDGASVLVTVFDLAGSPVDPPFVTCSVLSVIEGEGVGPVAPLPPPPVPPAPPAPARLFAWARVNALGVLTAQSVPPLVASVVRVGSVYTYTLSGGGPLTAMGAALSNAGNPPGGFGVLVTGPLTGTVQTFQQVIGANNIAHTVFFYGS